MTYRKAARSKWTKATREEAPVTWVELLRSAVDEPGVISQAFTAFHNYSLGNAVMALHQATRRGVAIGPMASYGKWQTLGRQVRKGEKAIWLNVPRTFKRRETDPKTGEEVEQVGKFFALKPAAFLYAQTEPIEGAEDKSGTLVYSALHWDAERALAAFDVTMAPFSDLNGNLQGYFLPKARTISINPVAAHAERTLLHELAHAVLHADGYAGCESRGLAEVEAESIAMLVAESLGLGGAAECRGYVQHWIAKSGYDSIDDKTARRIFTTAGKILNAGLTGSIETGEQAAA